MLLLGFNRYFFSVCSVQVEQTFGEAAHLAVALQG
jgi:hypothetical protein